MDEIIFVNSALARRLEMMQAWRGIEYTRAQGRLRPDSQSGVKTAAGGFALYAGPISPVNRAIGLGMQGPVAESDLDEVEQFYRSRGVLPRLDLCPLADPSLKELLKEKGYRLEGFSNVLAFSLADKVISIPLPPGVQISQARPAEAEVWITTTAQGFTELETPPQADLDILGPNFYSANATCFLAWLEGQPAGGGGMYIHEGVVEFGGASTHPAFRRRGIQMALLYARLAAAQEMGCDLALVVTAPGTDSQRNVERAGFRLAYTKVVMVAQAT
jgi:GNAT superfamily N-acetyltransferase